MERRKSATLLLACAVIFALGAYILIPTPEEEPNSVRQEVVQPVEKPEAPQWVDQGQEAKPDYTSADKEAQTITPEPTTKPETKSEVIEVTEDKMVTFTFVESLADFMLHRFIPQDTNGKPSSLASAKALNVYYGRELDGFSVGGNDIRMSRQKVLDYAFTPKMIKSLYEMYQPALMAHIVETAMNDDREYTVREVQANRTLNESELAAMLRLNAVRIDQTAQVFAAIADDPNITAMAGQFLQAAKAVERANEGLQNAISEGKDTSVESRRLKQVIIQREEMKKLIITTLGKACGGCPESELFYLAQWSYRRVLGQPEKKLDSFAAASEILSDLAIAFRDEAASLDQ